MSFKYFFGALKVIAVLALDLFLIFVFCGDVAIAAGIVVLIALYVLFGGYIGLLKEGAVRSDKLPEFQKHRLEAAKARLVTDIKSADGINIAGIKFYLSPVADMNGSAYGLNCISVTQGTMDNADPITLNAVLAHEISHILNLDAEFNRAVFASISVLLAGLSVASFSAAALLFILCLFLSCFRSWLGVLVFQGSKKVVGGIFGLLQHGVVILYRALMGIVSRHAEYRCDQFSCHLGFGVQLSYFLSIAAPEDQAHMTLTDAIYRSHPATPDRIARLERLMLEQDRLKSSKR